MEGRVGEVIRIVWGGDGEKSDEWKRGERIREKSVEWKRGEGWGGGMKCGGGEGEEEPGMQVKEGLRMS